MNWVVSFRMKIRKGKYNSQMALKGLAENYAPEIIKKYYADGHMIVIFTNQSKKWKCEQVQIVASKLNIPLFIVIATERVEYKPNLIMFDILFKGKKINKENSFFVGDALGRKTDFADTDKLQQVFTNLISNAIKYSPKGGTITIRLFEENNCC